MDLMLEKLNQGGTVTFSPGGTSMLPMLRDGEDAVILAKPKGRLHLYDLPLYRRPDGSFVLHRVVDFSTDGSYVMCGDNQFVKEYGIKDENIVAVVTAFYRKGKSYNLDSISYRIYIKFWAYSKPFRRIYHALKRRAVRLAGKFTRNNNNEKNTD